MIRISSHRHNRIQAPKCESDMLNGELICLVSLMMHTTRDSLLTSIINWIIGKLSLLLKSHTEKGCDNRQMNLPYKVEGINLWEDVNHSSKLIK